MKIELECLQNNFGYMTDDFKVFFLSSNSNPYRWYNIGIEKPET